MKKVTIIVLVAIAFISIFATIYNTYAVENSILSNEFEGQLVQIKKDGEKSLDDYKKQYGSDAYGVTAFILNIVRIYSIPFCFLGIAIGAIYQYVIGIRKLDTLEKGMRIVVVFITILVICQVLPLAFAVFVKFGRG